MTGVIRIPQTKTRLRSTKIFRGIGVHRPPHIHFEIRSKKSRLVTQMVFPGERLNATDELFIMLGELAPAAIGSVKPPESDMEKDSIHMHWDIVLFEK